MKYFKSIILGGAKVFGSATTLLLKVFFFFSFRTATVSGRLDAWSKYFTSIFNNFVGAPGLRLAVGVIAWIGFGVPRGGVEKL